MGSYAWKRRKLATVLNFRGVDHVGRLVIVVVSSNQLLDVEISLLRQNTPLTAGYGLCMLKSEKNG